MQQVTRNAIFGAHCAVASAFPGGRSNALLGSAHPHQNHHHHHHPPQHHQDPPNADAVCEMKEVEVGAEPALREEGARLEGWRAQHWRRLTFQATALTPALPSAHPPPPPPPQPSSASASTVACVSILPFPRLVVSINPGLRQHPSFPPSCCQHQLWPASASCLSFMILAVSVFSIRITISMTASLLDT